MRREFPKESLSEYPVLAPNITGIYLQGDGGSNSLFGGHDTMNVGGRLAEEFAQLSHQKTLSMITDEGKTLLRNDSIVLGTCLSCQKKSFDP